jgi:hypothetical protein
MVKGFKDYLFEYRYEGAEWGLTISAKNAHDAKERIKSLGLATYKGEVVAMIPVSLGVFAKVAAMVRNFLK